MSRAIPLLPLWSFVTCSGTKFTFTFVEYIHTTLCPLVWLMNTDVSEGHFPYTLKMKTVIPVEWDLCCFFYFTQGRIVVSYRRFGTTCRYLCHVQTVLQDITNSSETSGTDCNSILREVPKGSRSHLRREGNLKFHRTVLSTCEKKFYGYTQGKYETARKILSGIEFTSL